MPALGLIAALRPIRRAANRVTASRISTSKACRASRFSSDSQPRLGREPLIQNAAQPIQGRLQR